MRKRIAAASVMLAVACDTGYSVAIDDGGAGDAQSATSSDAGVADGASTTDGAAPKDGSAQNLPDAMTDSSTPDGGSNGPLASLGARLRLWLDATDTATVSTGGSVSAVASWTDKSGNHFIATPQTSGGTVSYATDADAGGVHGVVFAGGGWLSIPDSPALEFNKESFAIYVVARYAGVDEPNMFNDFVAKSQLGSSGYEFQLESNGTKICAEVGTAATACGTAVEGFGIFVYGALAAAGGGKGQLTVRQLGQLGGSTPGDVFADKAAFQIAHGVGGNFNFTGTIFEIVLVDQPTPTEAMAIASYLETKYGRP